jgi:predicted phosphodiesterase
MNEPVLILSDLHLGHGGSVLMDVSMIEPLLQDCKTLLLNGDTWQQLAVDFRADGMRLWTNLQDLCRKKNIEIVLLPGNHDPDAADVGWATLANGAIAITHGDAVYAEGAPWSRMALKLSKEIAAEWASYEPTNIAARLAVSRKIAHLLIPPHIAKSRNIFLRIWDAVTPPSRAFRMIVCWWCMVGQTRRFSREFFPKAKIIICGHFHRAGIWDDGKLLVINTGSYMPPGGAFWCEWKDGELRVGKVRIASSSCNRGALIGIWRFEG